MAAGAWWGGWLSDRRPSTGTLSMLWFGASITLGIAIPLRQLVFPLADWINLGAAVFLSALALFFLPLAFLAAVAPLAVKLGEPNYLNLGRMVGRISAIGTTGSCFGALLTGFLLVPNFTITRLFLYVSMTIALHGAVLFWNKGGKGKVAALVFLWGVCLALFLPQRPLSILGDRINATTMDIHESLYGQLQVVDASSWRYMFMDGVEQGLMEIPSGLSVEEYAPAMAVLGISAVPNAKRALFIGLGTGALPSSFLKRGFQVDVAEINPQVVKMSERWFNFSMPAANIHVEDGRRYLRKSHETFDLVCIDAFLGEDVPAYLLTRETFQEIRNRLSDGGALVMNYVGLSEPPSSRVLSTIAATLRSVYPSVDVFPLGEKGEILNFIIVARVKDGPWDSSIEIPWGGGKTEKAAMLLNNRSVLDKPYPFLITDAYCPMEWLDRVARFQFRKHCVSLMKMSTIGL